MIDKLIQYNIALTLADTIIEISNIGLTADESAQSLSTICNSGITFEQLKENIQQHADTLLYIQIQGDN